MPRCCLSARPVEVAVSLAALAPAPSGSASSHLSITTTSCPSRASEFVAGAAVHGFPRRGQAIRIARVVDIGQRWPSDEVSEGAEIGIGAVAEDSGGMDSAGTIAPAQVTKSTGTVPAPER